MFTMTLAIGLITVVAPLALALLMTGGERSAQPIPVRHTTRRRSR